MYFTFITVFDISKRLYIQIWLQGVASNIYKKGSRLKICTGPWNGVRFNGLPMPVNLYLFSILAFDKDIVSGGHVRGEAWGGKWWRRGREEPHRGRVYGWSLRFSMILILIFFFLVFNGIGYVFNRVHPVNF